MITNLCKDSDCYPIKYSPAMYAKSGSCKAHISAPKGEVFQVVNWWAKETGWVVNPSMQGLEFQLGNFYWPSLAAFRIGIQILKKDQNAEVAFSCIFSSVLQNKGQPRVVLCSTKADNERVAKRFANAVCYELSQRGFQIEPFQLTNSPGVNATQLAHRFKIATLLCRICLLLCIVPVIFIIIASIFSFPRLGYPLATTIFAWLGTFANAADLLRTRTIGAMGVCAIISTVGCAIAACLFTLFIALGLV